MTGWIWYLAIAGLWVFCFGVAYAFAGRSDRRWIARHFFAFPVWPFVLGSLAVVALVKLWSAADWKAAK